MKIRGQKKTDVGNVHSVNEDSCTLRWFRRLEGSCTPVVMAAVADGVGGLDNGEFASSAAVGICDRWFREEVPGLVMSVNEGAIPEALEKLMHRINSELISTSRERGFRTGTTLSLILIYEWKYYAANIGDSRIYEISRDRGLLQITDDDSWLQHEIDNMPEDVKSDSERKSCYIRALESDTRRNALIQCLGVTDDINPHCYTAGIEGTCWFVLCSDGFRNLMPERVFLDIMDEDEHMGLNCDDILESRIGFIKKRGERDNITAVLIKVYDDFTRKLNGG